MNQSNKPLNLPHLAQVCEAATPGEWQAFIMANGNGGDATPEFIAEYVKATILKSEQESGTTEFMFVSCQKPNGPADICHVGNGPTSKQNARFIATFNPSTVLSLLRRLMEAEAMATAAYEDRLMAYEQRDKQIAAIKEECTQRLAGMERYIESRRKTMKASIAAEVLSGNTVKESNERTALAELEAFAKQTLEGKQVQESGDL